MKKEEMLLETLINIAVNRQIPESKLFDLSDENNLNNLQYSKLCEILTLRGYDIVPDENIVYETETQEELMEKKDVFAPIITEFEKLSLNNKYKCLVQLAVKIAEEDQMAQKDIAKKFIEKVNKMNLQYSYIAVFIKGFFNKCNSMGQVNLDKLIDYFEQYYIKRLKNNFISEQSDSILGRGGFSRSDIRRIILFNPLKRSFLAHFFEYDKENDVIFVNEFLWDSLSNTDKKHIISVCDEKLERYYNRIK